MLDRLELADGPAELVPDLGVIRSGLDGPVGDSARLGAEQDRCETGHSGAVEAGQDPIGGHQRGVRPQIRQRPDEVDGVNGRHLEIGRVEQHPHLAVGRAGRCDHKVGQRSCKHRS